MDDLLVESPFSALVNDLRAGDSNPDPEVPIARRFAEPKKEPATRRRRWLIAAAALLLLIVAVAVGAGVGIKSARIREVDDGSLSGIQSTVAVVARSSAARSSTASVPKASSSAVAVAVSVPTSSARRIVVFGASYCDNGHPRASKYSGSLLPYPYYGGRHSNGIVWDEYLANLISVNGANDTQMRNYAYSGSMVDNSLYGANVPDTKSQMLSYISDVSSGLVPPLPAGGRTLIAVWAGLNPVMAVWRSATSKGLSAQNIASALASMTQEAQALLSQINNLRAHNGTTAADWLILPLPPTELLPYAVSTSKGIEGYLALYTSLTSTYNTVLSAGIAAMVATPTSTVLTYDIPTLYRSIVTNPSPVGLTDVTSPCVVGNGACSTPWDHMWWDSIHHTTTVHRYIAEKLAPAIRTLWKQ
ncbi:hypothetical protein RQP46_008852 [Phenoliferia psychrophenolica]